MWWKSGKVLKFSTTPRGALQKQIKSSVWLQTKHLHYSSVSNSIYAACVTQHLSCNCGKLCASVHSLQGSSREPWLYMAWQKASVYPQSSLCLPHSAENQQWVTVHTWDMEICPILLCKQLKRNEDIYHHSTKTDDQSDYMSRFFFIYVFAVKEQRVYQQRMLALLAYFRFFFYAKGSFLSGWCAHVFDSCISAGSLQVLLFFALRECNGPVNRTAAFHLNCSNPQHHTSAAAGSCR